MALGDDMFELADLRRNPRRCCRQMKFKRIPQTATSSAFDSSSCQQRRSRRRSWQSALAVDAVLPIESENQNQKQMQWTLGHAVAAKQLPPTQGRSEGEVLPRGSGKEGEGGGESSCVRKIQIMRQEANSNNYNNNNKKKDNEYRVTIIKWNKSTVETEQGKREGQRRHETKHKQ